MQALVERTGLQDGTLWLRDIGTLGLNRAGRELRADWLDGFPSAGPATDHGAVGLRAGSVDHAVHAAETPAGHYMNATLQAGAKRVMSIVLPVLYAEVPIGEIRLECQADSREAELALFRQFARACAYLAKRYEVQRWAERRLGRPLLLVGASKPLLEMEAFVERATRSELPTLLAGEFGTEKALLAAAIHCCGPARDGPFIEVNCAEPVGSPAQWFEQAKGGTLFFSGIDELAPALQAQIPQHMHSRLGQWLVASGAADLRVIASTTADLTERILDGRFSRRLFVELDFLSITVPPLRQRTADIEALVLSALERHGYGAEQKCSGVLMEACKTHAWPENLFELERVIARLAVMTDARPIGRADLQRYAPWLLAEVAAPETGEGTDCGADEACDTEDSAAIPDRWVRSAIAGDLTELKKLHESLGKALLYLGKHYAESISLGELARQAHISPSHLTYLFRRELGTAFKPFLLGIRVHKAKEILLGNARQRITEVAMSVGFTDLSHFEKSFRRIVGQSPREFRHAMGAVKLRR